jgi:hypothetical protein
MENFQFICGCGRVIAWAKPWGALEDNLTFWRRCRFCGSDPEKRLDEEYAKYRWELYLEWKKREGA